jgi:hypothetical protein
VSGEVSETLAELSIGDDLQHRGPVSQISRGGFWQSKVIGTFERRWLRRGRYRTCSQRKEGASHTTLESRGLEGREKTGYAY